MKILITIFFTNLSKSLKLRLMIYIKLCNKEEKTSKFVENIGTRWLLVKIFEENQWKFISKENWSWSGWLLINVVKYLISQRKRHSGEFQCNDKVSSEQRMSIFGFSIFHLKVIVLFTVLCVSFNHKIAV